MRGTGVAELSPRALQGALYDTTEKLAAELAAPAQAAPEWSEPEWLMARAVAAIHGIAPLLGTALRWRGPEGWTRFLREETEREQRRHWQIREVLLGLDDLLQRTAIPALALKGAALHEPGLYRPGERPMADVDLLVRGSDFERASQALERLGFQESWRLWKNTIFSARAGGRFSAPQWSGEHPLKIELHERICERLPARLTDITEFVFPADAKPGLNSYGSRHSLIAHLLLHAAGGLATRSLRLIQLHDIALLAGIATDEDWVGTFALEPAGPAPWWAFPPLELAARYYPSRIPQWVLDRARSGCPALLRRIATRRSLSDVSLSFPWTEAFPGIAWARSPAEALEYVARRVVSDRDEVSMRAWASKTEPGLSPGERSWLAGSQGGRILRWLVSRPARSLTMRAVRIAFGETF